jgi:hypothetical protein
LPEHTSSDGSQDSMFSSLTQWAFWPFGRGHPWLNTEEKVKCIRAAHLSVIVVMLKTKFLPSIFGALKEIDYESTITLELEVEDVKNAPSYVEEAYQSILEMLDGMPRVMPYGVDNWGIKADQPNN